MVKSEKKTRRKSSSKMFQRYSKILNEISRGGNLSPEQSALRDAAGSNPLLLLNKEFRARMEEGYDNLTKKEKKDLSSLSNLYRNTAENFYSDIANGEVEMHDQRDVLEQSSLLQAKYNHYSSMGEDPGDMGEAVQITQQHPDLWGNFEFLNRLQSKYDSLPEGISDLETVKVISSEIVQSVKDAKLEIEEKIDNKDLPEDKKKSSKVKNFGKKALDIAAHSSSISNTGSIVYTSTMLAMGGNPITLGPAIAFTAGAMAYLSKKELEIERLENAKIQVENLGKANRVIESEQKENPALNTIELQSPSHMHEYRDHTDDITKSLHNDSSNKDTPRTFSKRGISRKGSSVVKSSLESGVPKSVMNYANIAVSGASIAASAASSALSAASLPSTVAAIYTRSQKRKDIRLSNDDRVAQDNLDNDTLMTINKEQLDVLRKYSTQRQIMADTMTSLSVKAEGDKELDDLLKKETLSGDEKERLHSTMTNAYADAMEFKLDKEGDLQDYTPRKKLTRRESIKHGVGMMMSNYQPIKKLRKGHDNDEKYTPLSKEKFREYLREKTIISDLGPSFQNVATSLKNSIGSGQQQKENGNTFVLPTPRTKSKERGI